MTTLFEERFNIFLTEFKKYSYIKLTNEIQQHIKTAIINSGFTKCDCCYLIGMRNSEQFDNLLNKLFNDYNKIPDNYREAFWQAFNKAGLDFNGIKTKINQTGMKEIKDYYVHNGFLQTHYYRLNGKKEGEYKCYQETGQLISRHVYHDDKQNGELLCWDDNGKLRARVFYQDDKVVDYSVSILYNLEKNQKIINNKNKEDIESLIKLNRIKDEEMALMRKKMEEMMNLLKELSNKVKISSIDPTEIQPGEQ